MQQKRKEAIHREESNGLKKVTKFDKGLSIDVLDCSQQLPTKIKPLDFSAVAEYLPLLLQQYPSSVKLVS